MRSEIQQLQKRLGITTVYVTHDQEEAMAISDRIAVMSTGSIVQIGSAEDLYDRPTNEFVARFIGRTNLFDGKLRSRTASETVVEVLGQAIAAPSVPEGLNAGDAVRVMIRPERIRLTNDGGDGTQGMVAKVSSRTFLGEKTEYHVAVGNQVIQATLYGDARHAAFAVGDSVRAVLPDDGIHLMRP